MASRILRALPAWQDRLREFNTGKAPLAVPAASCGPEALHADRWGIVAAALVLGLTVGASLATLWWSAEVRGIVDRQVAARVAPQVLR